MGSGRTSAQDAEYSAAAMNDARIAITHASGLLAESLLKLLAESGVEPDSVVLLDVPEQAGNRLAYGNTHITLLDQYEYDYENLLAVYLLQADDELQGLLEHADCFLVSHHLPADIRPLDVSRLNDSSQLPASPGPIKLPNAELATLLSVIQPVLAEHQLASIQVVNIKSASMYGQTAVEELASQTISLLNSREVSAAVLPLQQAFNMQPEMADADAGEILLQILDSTTIQCSVQTMIVAAFHGLAISVNLEFERAVDLNRVNEQWKGLPGIRVSDEIVSPVTHCNSGADIFIYGVLQPQKDAKRLQFWIIADGIRNGLVKNYQKVSDVLINSFL